jgi:ornithine carbamoyltransferase
MLNWICSTVLCLVRPKFETVNFNYISDYKDNVCASICVAHVVVFGTRLRQLCPILLSRWTQDSIHHKTHGLGQHLTQTAT